MLEWLISNKLSRINLCILLVYFCLHLSFVVNQLIWQQVLWVCIEFACLLNVTCNFSLDMAPRRSAVCIQKTTLWLCTAREIRSKDPDFGVDQRLRPRTLSAPQLHHSTTCQGWEISRLFSEIMPGLPSYEFCIHIHASLVLKCFILGRVCGGRLGPSTWHLACWCVWPYLQEYSVQNAVIYT